MNSQSVQSLQLRTVPRPAFAQEIAFASPFGPLTKVPGHAAGQVRVTVQGRRHEAVEEVRAYLSRSDTAGRKTEQTVGRLNVIAYDAAFRTLVLVPVGGTALPIDRSALERELNRIYGQAAVQWAVRTEEGFQSTYDTNNNGLDYGSSGLLSNYTAEMRTILKDYTRSRPLAPHTYYLFVVPRANQSEVTGYMPRRRQAGFLFADNITASNAAKIIAHELGHGAFRLKHTFPELPQNGNNLMDYSATGITLHKHQWDDIHHPQTVLGLFEGDEDAAAYSCPRWFSGECDDVGRILDLIKTTVQKGTKVKVTGAQNEDRRELIAENIDLDGTRFRKIKVVNEVERGKNYTFDPKNYEEYIGQHFTADGGVDDQRGFVYRSGPGAGTVLGTTAPAPEMVKILLYEREEDFKEKKEALREYLFGGGIGPKKTGSSDTIRIYITRTHTGNNSTTGTLTTDDGAISGYTVELPRGNDSECHTICNDAIKPFDCHCIAEGVYLFEINTKSYEDESTKNFSLRVTSDVPKGRTGILLHGGRDDAKGWSQGCILPMPNAPEINSALYSEYRNNTVGQSIDFTKKILEWVRFREATIKKRNKDAKIIRQIIINKTF
jgi:hypothetical protein